MYLHQVYSIHDRSCLGKQHYSLYQQRSAAVVYRVPLFFVGLTAADDIHTCLYNMAAVPRRSRNCCVWRSPPGGLLTHLAATHLVYPDTAVLLFRTTSGVFGWFPTGLPRPTFVISHDERSTRSGFCICCVDPPCLLSVYNTTALSHNHNTTTTVWSCVPSS